jgi:hypothetical protein
MRNLRTGTNLEINSNAQFCPECQNSRTILLDCLNGKGMSRKSNAVRKQTALEIIAKCKICQKYFEDLEEMGKSSKRNEFISSILSPEQRKAGLRLVNRCVNVNSGNGEYLLSFLLLRSRIRSRR